MKIKPYQKKAINIQEEEEEEEDIRPNLNLLDDSIDYSISNYESKKNTKNTQKEKETPKETLKSSSEKKRKIDSIETDEYGRKRFVFQKPNFSEENQSSTLKTIQKKLIYKSKFSIFNMYLNNLFFNLEKDEEKNVPIFQSSRASRDLTPQQIRKSQQEHQRKLKRWEVKNYIF